MTLTILRVDETTVGQGLRQFCITGHRNAKDISELWQLETLSAWKALACKRARDLGKRARIVWRDGGRTRWGGRFPKQIVSVELL